MVYLIRKSPKMHCTCELPIGLLDIFTATLKQARSQDEIVIKTCKLHQCSWAWYMRKWFLNFKGALLKRKINVKFLLASLKTITNSKRPKDATKFLFRLSFSVIGRFYSLYLQSLYIHVISGFRKNFQDKRQFLEQMLES